MIQIGPHTFVNSTEVTFAERQFDEEAYNAHSYSHFTYNRAVESLASGEYARAAKIGLENRVADTSDEHKIAPNREDYYVTYVFTSSGQFRKTKTDVGTIIARLNAANL